jgi:hypothetical protein
MPTLVVAQPAAAEAVDMLVAADTAGNFTRQKHKGLRSNPQPLFFEIR